MANRRVRKTSPGFGDPEQRLALERAFATWDKVSVGETPPQHTDPPPEKPTQVASVPPSPRVSARRLSSLPPRSRADTGPKSAAGEQDRSRTASRAMLNVEVHYAAGPAPKADPRFLELWTQNTVYVLDADMRCIAVRSAGSREDQAKHPFIGARLVGGQLKDGAGIELSYPLPRPGSAAVFEEDRGPKRKFTRTSAVVRIVLQMNIARVTNEALLTTLTDLAESPE